MGAWGTGLYANDTTCDVNDTYIEALQEQLSNAEAYQKTMQKHSVLIGDFEEPLLWLALAESQWKVGRLMPEVKEKALYWIEQKGGLDLWEDSADKGAGWLKTLDKLKKKLQSPMRTEKKIKKPEDVNMNLWEINDIYAYRFNKKNSQEHGYWGKYMLLQKIGEDAIESYKKKRMMRVQIFDKMFDELPTLDDIDGLRILPVDFPTRINISEDRYVNGEYREKKDPIWMSGSLFVYSLKFHYPEKFLTFIGNKQGPSNIRLNEREFPWHDIDNLLFKYYELWHGIEYDTVAYGEYEYIRQK